MDIVLRSILADFNLVVKYSVVISTLTHRRNFGGFCFDGHEGRPPNDSLQDLRSINSNLSQLTNNTILTLLFDPEH